MQKSASQRESLVAEMNKLGTYDARGQSSASAASYLFLLKLFTSRFERCNFRVDPETRGDPPLAASRYDPHVLDNSGNGTGSLGTAGKPSAGCRSRVSAFRSPWLSLVHPFME